MAGFARNEHNKYFRSAALQRFDARGQMNRELLALASISLFAVSSRFDSSAAAETARRWRTWQRRVAPASLTGIPGIRYPESHHIPPGPHRQALAVSGR